MQQIQALEKITGISQFPNYKVQLWHEHLVRELEGKSDVNSLLNFEC